MESSSSSSFQSLGASEYAISHLDRFNLFILRPFLAVTFVLSVILLGWVLAWKLVLVHVPLVQEIFGLRNKPRKSKPQTGRLSRFYSNINSRDPASGWASDDMVPIYPPGWTTDYIGSLIGNDSFGL